MKKNRLIMIGINVSIALHASAPVSISESHRSTSQVILVTSTLKKQYAVGDPKIWGEIYDVRIIEDNFVPTHVVAYTTKELKITWDWECLIKKAPKGRIVAITDEPKPSPHIYAVLSSLHNWRIVIRNRDENNTPLKCITLKLYQETTKEEEHLLPLFTIPGPNS